MASINKKELYSSQLPLDMEDIKELEGLLNKRHSLFLEDRNFSIELDREGPVIMVTVLLKNRDESYYYPVETRIDCEEQEMNPQEAALFLVDFIDLYFEEYLSEDENLFIPIDWTPYNYEAIDFQMKAQVINRKLEKMADEWLAKSSTQQPTDLH